MTSFETAALLVSTLPPAEKARFIRNLTAETPPPAEAVPRLLRAREVATRLSCTTRTVYNLGLDPVRFPGRKRGAGFRESDVAALVAGKGG